MEEKEFIKEQKTVINNLYYKYELLYNWLDKQKGLIPPESVKKYISKLDERYPTIIPRRENDKPK